MLHDGSKAPTCRLPAPWCNQQTAIWLCLCKLRRAGAQHTGGSVQAPYLGCHRYLQRAQPSIYEYVCTSICSNQYVCMSICIDKHVCTSICIDKHVCMSAFYGTHSCVFSGLCPSTQVHASSDLWPHMRHTHTRIRTQGRRAHTHRQKRAQRRMRLNELAV